MKTKNKLTNLILIFLQIVVFGNCKEGISQKVIAKKENYPQIIKKEKSFDEWIFNKLIKKTENEDIDSIEKNMSNFKIRIIRDTFYLDKKYKFYVKKETIDSRKFFRHNYLYNFYVNLFKKEYNIDIKDNLQYLQFYGVKNNYIKNYLTELKAAIYIKDQLFLEDHDYIVNYLKPYNSKNFEKIYNDLAILKWPFQYQDIQANNKFISISQNFQSFLDLNYLDQYSAIKLSAKNENIKPVLISAYQQVGEIDSYLYLFSKDYEILDRLTLFHIEGETESGNNVGCTFSIEEDSKIKITEHFQNDKTTIKYYIINNNGKFIEVKK